MDLNMKTKFYVCEKCGNLVDMVNDSGVNPVCCGQKMTELKAGVVEASREKHIPVVNVEGSVVKVSVGAVEHPMSAEHSIEWIVLETDRSVQRKHLAPGDAPSVEFRIGDEKPIAVYAYCNLHGLWRADV
jgi:superoxide reductase